MQESTFYPKDEPALRKKVLIPQVILFWARALPCCCLRLTPIGADTILALGYIYCIRHIIVGDHWQSAVDAGRLAASAAYTHLHTNKSFLEHMRLAGQEFRIKNGLVTAAEMKVYGKAAKKRAKAK